MKFPTFHIIIVLCLLHCELLCAQKEEYSKYYYIRKNYEVFSENDVRALPFIQQYIAEAKKDKDYGKLYQGYADGVEFSSDRNIKLKFADSTIIAAKLSRKDSLVSSAYLEKGVVYYFHFKKYQLALNEFLVAVSYADKDTDPYYKNRLNYLIGVVKSYIGYYDEALPIFMKTQNYYASELRKQPHPNILYDSRRGYYNSLHQMAICYRNMGKYALVDSIVSIGLTEIGANKEHRQEFGYFLKEKGISEFRKKEYSTALASLSASSVALSKINDFAWLAVNYSYLGKSYLGLGDKPHAVRNFKKVDSIFQKYGFIVPEVRETFELLIDEYKANNDVEKQLYYTNQLLKVDSVLFRDFNYLLRKMSKEYDTRLLKEDKKRLEKQSANDNLAKWGLGTVAVSFAATMLFYKRREKRIRRKYSVLEQKIIARDNADLAIITHEKQEDNKLEIDPKIVEEILHKLQNFEKKGGFRENGLTQHKLADKFDTNHYYLSQIVNEYKGMNFTKYLIELRIRYITDKLYNDPEYRKYKIVTLAEECGMSSRNNFSKLFREINGIGPADFIKRRVKDINKEQNLAIETVI
ncbi:AraC-like DNA-binding protein [Chryseobacterium rhizosphaerae]|uniref:helix-turn-helix domain-containing protein n=1 Tax=Chryseobacterium rhizosphaerae TaxID=395937 RepID=UPI002861BF93|nr:helix-turn-helix domain-containing protein [Chryseobacterium rhizosphaerae]MDR6546479.1 AraC-like DNA-binding protein [Chryseobacterium rhizosphaerae]